MMLIPTKALEAKALEANTPPEEAEKIFNNVVKTESYKNIKTKLENTVAEEIKTSVEKGWLESQQYIDTKLFSDDKFDRYTIAAYAYNTVISSLKDNGYTVYEPKIISSVDGGFLFYMTIKW